MIPFRHSMIFLATLGWLAACDNSADTDNQAASPAPAATEQATARAGPEASTAEANSDAEEAAAEQAAEGQPTGDPGTVELPVNVNEVTQREAAPPMP